MYGGNKADLPYYTYSSTAAEGFGRGVGDIIRRAGEYNSLSADAAVKYAEARRREIENNKAWVQTYFETRDINWQAREADLKRRRGTMDDWVRYAQADRPKPLSNQALDATTGKISWPILLTSADFSQQRAELEKAFADRAYHGVLGAAEFVKVTQTTNSMLASLKSQVRDLPSDKYVEAKRFLESLAFQARQPAG